MLFLNVNDVEVTEEVFKGEDSHNAMSSSYYLPVMSTNTFVNSLSSDQGTPLNTFSNPMFIPGSDQHYALSHPAQLFCLSLSQQENVPLLCASPTSPHTFPGENRSEIDWTIPQLSTFFLIPIETLTNAIPSPCAEASETPSTPPLLAKQPEPRFKEEKQVSKHGKHDVLVYPIPESSLAYVFSLRRKNDGYAIYRCDLCKRKGAYASIQVGYTTVIEDEFVSDPCKLEHVCIPVIRAHDMVERMIMKRLRQIRNAPTSGRITSPKQEMEEIRMQILENEEIDDSLRKEMLEYCDKKLYERKRTSISRAVRANKRKTGITTFQDSHELQGGVGNESSPEQLKSSVPQEYVGKKGFKNNASTAKTTLLSGSCGFPR
ncbi:hypothetical protein ANCCAN_21578 [Ancylostoma caninum]|uniref:Uncharacterized protein n=1 Tax=Ancylostoma caninum TaxID=29170 RepID=A0A368FKE0_ANCCA|nr:hypothetical protein ANCCAN_21578 [Ancylostoma caninum]